MFRSIGHVVHAVASGEVDVVVVEDPYPAIRHQRPRPGNGVKGSNQFQVRGVVSENAVHHAGGKRVDTGGF